MQEKTQCKVLALAHTKSIFLGITRLEISPSMLKKLEQYRFASCSRYPLMPDYAHQTLHATPEIDRITASSPEFPSAWRQLEVLGRASWALIGYCLSGHKQFPFCKIHSAPHAGTRSGGGARTQLPPKFYGTFAAPAEEFYDWRGRAGNQ